MMKHLNKQLVFFVTILLPCFCFAQIQTNQKLFPVTMDEKCGYIDEKGALVVPFQYDSCNEFEEGLGAVLLNNKYGFINTYGRLISEMKFEDYISPNFSEGVAPVIFTNHKGGKTVGYIDKSGSILPVEGVDKTYNFSDGMAKFQKDGLYGFIDRSMKIVIPAKYTFVHGFSEGLALVVISGKSRGFINKQGEKIIEGMEISNSFSEGLVQVRDRYGLYGFIDIKGKLVVPNKLGTPCSFSNGLACSEQNGKWGYINKSGEFTINSRFDSAESFSADGYAVVGLNGKFGLINLKGEMILEPIYDSLDWLSGLARVGTDKGVQYVTLNGEAVWPNK